MKKAIIPSVLFISVLVIAAFFAYERTAGRGCKTRSGSDDRSRSKPVLVHQ